MTRITILINDSNASALVEGKLTAHAVGIRVIKNIRGERWDGLTNKLVARNSKKCVEIINGILPHELLEKGETIYIGADGWNLDGSLRIPTIWAKCGIVCESVADCNSDAPAPDPSPSIVDQILSAAQNAERTANEVERRANAGEFDGKPGDDGHSPYIGDDGIWYVYSDSLQQYVSTGIKAKGEKGDTGDIDEVIIVNAISEYLQKHPIDVPVKSVNGQTGDVKIDIPDISGKQDTISDLDAIRAGAAAGATALQSETDPTVPSWAKQPSKPTYTAAEVGALPVGTPIPSAVTEQTVAGWGFTKNTGTYTKPAGGIPASDLASGVIPTIPQKLPTPNKLTFTGAATGEFDGSSPLSIEIPQGGDGGGGTLRKIVDITLEQDVNVFEVIPGEMLPGLYLMDCYYTATAQNAKEEQAFVQMNCGASIVQVANNYAIRTRGVIRSVNFIVVGTNTTIMYGGGYSLQTAAKQSEPDSYCYGLKIVPFTTTQYVATGTRIKVYAVLGEE